MKKFKITYNEGYSHNLTCEVEADFAHNAEVVFIMEHPNYDEIVKIEEVTEEDD